MPLHWKSAVGCNLSALWVSLSAVCVCVCVCVCDCISGGRSVSTTVDPFWDISLDLGSVSIPSKNVSKMTATANVGSPTKSCPSSFGMYNY